MNALRTLGVRRAAATAKTAAPFALIIASFSTTARATSFADYGKDLGVAPTETVLIDGSFRTRAALLYNLDLDRGPTPSGQLLYPVPIDDPKGQTLTHADMRLRTDLAFLAPGGGVAVKARIDIFDNVALGSRPDGIPSATGTQRSPDDPIRIKRVWGEALTPFGVLAVGRMGSHWGLGMLSNSGDCADCDSGDSADRVAFVTPLAHHLWAAAYDFSATGPFVPDRSESRVIDIAPETNVHTLTFAFMRHRSDWAQKRRSDAGKYTFDYGAYVSRRWQKDDVPAGYLPTATPVAIDENQVVSRGYTATAADIWLRFVGKGVRVEFEGAYLNAKVDQPSLIPGVVVREAATSDQFGAALQSEFGDEAAALAGGLDAGYASGDAAPGFGAFPKVGAPVPVAGDLDGAQARPPFDNTVNNFRFHPDYRVDRILFREIIGTVTDAVYLRPHGRWTLLNMPTGELSLEVAVIASWAVDATSTPGGKAALGVETNETIAYRSHDGFEFALEQATLFPMAGLDNPALGLKSENAQLWRARAAFYF
ncbi:MAG TPA: TIGR04551 family protein [Polyangiaceae bacterium]|nr:TIGR04551 family protein [Polyangiaceae bacterium]